MQHNSPLHKQTTDYNRAKLFEMHIYHRLSHEIHKPMNQTLRKSIYSESYMQMGTPRFLL